MTEKEELLESIRFVKDSEKEEFMRIVLETIPVFLRSSVIFGINSTQSKTCLSIIKKMYKILKEERRLLNLIESNIDSVDIYDAEDAFDLLDSLNDDTYNSFIFTLSNIDYACDTRDDRRSLIVRSDIDSLINNDEYKKKVLELIGKEPTQNK